MIEAPSSDIAFTPAIKAIQVARGSRDHYAQIEADGGFRTRIDADLSQFLAQVDTAYFVTANAAGQPYAQHRGGPKGFIQVIDEATLGFVDFAGNRQYVTTGNLSENASAFMFLMDYAHRRRIKLWGRGRVVTDDPALIARLMPKGYRARAEQAILFTLTAWEQNCSQHIPQKVDLADVAGSMQHLEARITELERENVALKQAMATRP